MTRDEVPDSGAIEACSSCGACCVDSLVLVDPNNKIPMHMVDGGLMRKQFGRCIALTGRVGKKWVGCAIYDDRPKICRALSPRSWACLELRQSCGLFGPLKEEPSDGH